MSVPGLYRKNRLIVLLLVATGCTKDIVPPIPSSTQTQAESIKRLQQEFQQYHYDQKLAQIIHGNSQNTSAWSWEPEWSKASLRQVNDSISYAYVPIAPLSPDSRYPVALLEARKYILIRQSSKKSFFGIITYLSSQSASSIKEEFTPNFFDTFSGKVLIQGLDNNKQTQLIYQGGILQKQVASNAKVSATTTTNAVVCHTDYTCYWTYSCRTMSQAGNPISVGTMTTGVDYCAQPQYTPSYGDCIEGYWVKTDQTTVTSCKDTEPSNPNPTYPTDPGPGPTYPTGPTGTTSPPGNTNPCGTLNPLGADAGFGQLMTDLKSKTNLNYEVGYTYNKTGGTVTNRNLQQGSPNSASIDLRFNGQIDGYMHTHYSGLLSVFSATDMRSIYELCKNNLINNVSTFSAQVITANGTSYSLTISDPAALKKFGDVWFVDGPYWQTFEQIFYDRRFNIKTSNPNDVNEAGFANMLSTCGMGLILTKGDPNNFSSWSILSVDSNQNVVSNSCL